MSYINTKLANRRLRINRVNIRRIIRLYIKVNRINKAIIMRYTNSMWRNTY